MFSVTFTAFSTPFSVTLTAFCVKSMLVNRCNYGDFHDRASIIPIALCRPFPQLRVSSVGFTSWYLVVSVIHNCVANGTLAFVSKLRAISSVIQNNDIAID